MRKVLSVLVLLFWLGPAYGSGPVRIDFFYEPGCSACERIESALFPELERRFAGSYELYAHDIGIEAHFLGLLRLEGRRGYAGTERAYLAVNQEVLFGANVSAEKLFFAVQQALEQGALAAGAAEEPAVEEEGSGWLRKRFSRFTLPAVMAAGLLDGINPCAMSTLVFFMSLLTVSRVRDRQLILLGVSFCTASFLTYLALGFGLFRVLHLFSGFFLLRRILERVMLLILSVLALLSFRDAFRFRKSRRSADVTIQLPSGIKKKIHAVMRRGAGGPGLLLGGGVAGTVVTVLESVCTGQVYVPTLVLILKENSFYEPRAWVFLLAYNLMFILPLTAVFTAVYFGVRTETLLVWSRRNVVVSKILLGLLFAVMGLLIVFL